MRYFIIAGEPSGDVLGSLLIRALKRKDPEAVFEVWGGDKMEKEGAKVNTHIRELSYFGVWQVLLHLRIILKKIKACKQDIRTFQPDVVIGIDYPGFNLKLLTWAKRNGYKTIQYVLPHVWLWKENRIKTLRRYVDEILAILPFEKSFCAERDLPQVTYIGHPLIESIRHFHTESQNTYAPFPYENHMVLLPGSRPNEIHRFLPILLRAVVAFPQERFVIIRLPHIPQEQYERHLKTYPWDNIVLMDVPVMLALPTAKAAIVKSGTSTLEVALHKVPMIVVYKLNAFNELLSQIFLKLKFAALPNIIMDKEIAKELLRSRFTSTNVQRELERILHDQAYIQEMRNNFDALEKNMEVKEAPSVLAAQRVWDVLHRL